MTAGLYCRARSDRRTIRCHDADKMWVSGDTGWWSRPCGGALTLTIPFSLWTFEDLRSQTPADSDRRIPVRGGEMPPAARRRWRAAISSAARRRVGVSAVKPSVAKTRALCSPRGCSAFNQCPGSFCRSTMAASPFGIFIAYGVVECVAHVCAARGSSGIDHQLVDSTTGGINYVSWNSPDRRSSETHEHLNQRLWRRSPAMSSLRRSKASRCDSAYSVNCRFAVTSVFRMGRSSASRRFAVVRHLARNPAMAIVGASLFSRAGRIYAV